jgi:xanthine dehydrogenase accessory factor
MNFVQKRWATEEQWSAIHAPIGLDINSKTVEEIAISIAAELVLERNRVK